MAGPPNATPTMKIMYEGGPILNIISLTFSCIPLLLLIVLFFKNRTLLNRISLRLQGGVAFFDFTNHLCTLFFITTPQGGACNFIGFWRFFGRQMYCWLNIAIAFNLQRVFLQNKTFNPKWEYFYWGIALVVAFVSSIPLGALGLLGKAKNGFCQLDASLPVEQSKYIQFFLVAFPMIITAIYCLVITCLVITKLRKNINAIENPTFATFQDESRKTDQQKFIKKLIFRISLYPLVCCICLSGVAVQSLAQLAGDTTEWLAVWAAFGSELVGFFNCIAFLLDPTLHMALKQIIRNANNRNSHHENIEFTDMESKKVGYTDDQYNDALLNSTKAF